MTLLSKINFLSFIKFANEKMNMIRLAYIYHHLATRYFITFPTKQYFSDKVFDDPDIIIAVI